MTLKRKEFIAHSARMAALAALGVQLTEEDELQAAADLDWQKAPCRFCGTGCGAMVGVKKGKVVAVKGDRLNPVNKGLLCVKGYNAGNALYGKDRLTYPMIRKNGKLVRASWDEALTLVARKIIESPKHFAIYGSGQWTIPEGYVAMKFLKGGLNSNQIDPNARLCMASAVVGFIKTFGADEPPGCYDDLDECDTVITWGNNWAEMHPILYSRFIDRRNSGKRLVAIDISTRKTRTTDTADYYLEFVPQTDMAIANCICHQLLERNTYDKQFVNEKVVFKNNDGKPLSLSQYKLLLKDYSPEKVSKTSGVSVENLKLLGDVFSDRSRKVVSLWCMGVNQHTRGTAMNNLIYNVHLLSGKIGIPGSTPFSLTGQPSACGTCREVGTLAHALPGGRVVKNEEHRRESEDIWNVKRGAINPKPGFHTIKMFKEFSAGGLKGMWVQVTNPGQSIPNLNENMINDKDRLLVVSDVYPTATTVMADVVLPSALWVEKNGMVGNSERRTQQWFKMVDPPGEARDDVWQMIAVARKMYEMGFEGMKDRDGQFLLNVKNEKGEVVEAWKWDVFKAINADKHFFEEYRKFTVKKHKDLAPYEEYVRNRGLRWPVTQQFNNWVETKWRYVEGEDPFVKKGQGLYFYNAKNGEGKANVWMRPYEAPPEVPDQEFPFWLCTGRVVEHWHTGTMTGRVPALRNAMPNAYVEIHPSDFMKLKLKEGEHVKIISRRGECILPVTAMGRAKPQKGLVFVPFFDELKLINQVTLDAYCPMSKEPDYKKCAVKLEKV